MEEKNWVMRLCPGDDITHPLPIKAAVSSPVKKEVKREIKVDKGILGGRPFLKEAIEEGALFGGPATLLG